MLKDKVVFVSGGTGYLGSAICGLCVEYGARVIFSYSENESKAEELKDQLEGSSAIRINFKDPEDIKKKIDALHDKIEAVDVIVNNAGVSQVMPFSLLEPDDVNFMLDVNVRGTMLLTKALLRRMVKRKKGSIVNIGSIAGHRMFDVPVHYAASKAAVAGLTYSLATELKRFGIRVNSVVPGMLEDGVARGIPEELRRDYLKHCAAGRPGTGREVAEVVCFLASDRSSYVNGQNIMVDGGI